MNSNYLQMNPNYLQTVCGVCKAPISLQQDWQINGLAACGLCMYDYELTKTTLPCPYKTPRPRKLIERSKKQEAQQTHIVPVGLSREWIPMQNKLSLKTTVAHTMAAAQATCGYTSVEQAARFLQDPLGGL